ncbi:glycosyltransferase [Pseudonocardia bannensis]|uniref:glycosyltransferase n=1 Tax=Pseudonocardia bannensis TaxID=630973 RepID=UPI001B7D126F|nr:glycosyltransferase [Pseudonocardia bannensis]
MRVLFIVPRLGIGGAERHVATLMPRLDPARFAPSLVCIGQAGMLFDEVVAAGIPARALNRTRREMALALAELVVHMRRTRPDMVVLRGANAEALGRIAAVISGVPRTVLWVHNNADVTPRSRLRRLADRVLEPVTSAYYGVAFGQLPYLVDELGYPREKVRIIQNGVDLTRFEADRSAMRDPALAAELGVGLDEPVAGIVAVLRPEKDHATFLRAARLVLEREPRARFLVIGRGALEAELKSLAAELGLGDRVIFTGIRSDVDALLRLMDVFVLTSFTEAFPMALLEAMAVGRPAVCTAVGGMPEMIEEGVTGYLVQPGDPTELAERLLTLFGDRARARAMGVAARERLEGEFTLERSLQRAELAINETAGRVPTSV